MNWMTDEAWSLCWLLAFTLLLGWASASDVRSGRVSNVLVGAGLLAGLLLSATPAGVGLLSALAGAAIGLLALMPLYLLRMMGAGDVKLLSAVGAFVGYPSIVGVTLAMFVAGGGLALAWAIRYGLTAQVLRNLRRGLRSVVTAPMLPGSLASRLSMPVSSMRIPYAVAIAAAGAVYLWRSERLDAAWNLARHALA